MAEGWQRAATAAGTILARGATLRQLEIYFERRRQNADNGHGFYIEERERRGVRHDRLGKLETQSKRAEGKFSWDLQSQNGFLPVGK
jgi:hypothetical protein